MKHIKFLLSLLLTTLLGVGQMWATDVSFAFTTIGTTGWGGYADHTVSCTDGTVSMNASKQSGTITDIPVTKGQPVSFVLTDNSKSLSAISFTCRQWGSKAQTITLKYSTNGGSSYSALSPSVTSTNFSISSSSLPTGTNAVQISFSSTSNQVGVESMSYTLAGSTPTPTVSADPDEVEVEAEAHASQSLDLTYENWGTVTVDDVVATLWNDAACTETFDGGWISNVSVAAGNASVSFDIAANAGAARAAYLKIYALGNDASTDAETIVSISQAKYAAPTGTFEPFSGDIEEGDYLIVADGAGMNTTVSGNRLQYTALTLTGENYVNPDESVIWHIAESATAGYWTIYSGAESKYAAATGSNNQAQMLESGTDNKSLWEITHSEAVYTITNKSNSRFLKKNGTYGFGCYADGTVSLYKKQVAGQPKAPTFSVPGGNYENAQSVELSCETQGATIYYTTNGDAPTSSSTQYNGTAIAVDHTMTIKAIAIKDEIASTIASATYTIIVWQTVADVWDDITTEGPLNAHIYGYVSQTNVSGYANNFYISDNGSTEGNQLYAYRMDMNSYSVAVGDKVKLAGDLTIHNEVKEFKYTNAENCGKVIALEAKGALQSVAVSGTPIKTEYAANEDFDPTGLKVMGTYANGFVGEITEGITWSNDLTGGKVTESTTVHVTATVSEIASSAYDVAVTVAAKTLVSIALSYDAVEVYQGLELPKPTVTATYSEGDPEDVTAQAVFTGYDASTTGDQEITVTYTFGGHDETANYTVTVNPIFNVELAASVARNLIVNVVGNTESTDDMIVRGKVSYINNASSKVQTYWISDDGTRTNEVEIFKGKYLSGADFTSVNQLRVGDEVVVIGKVINYNNSTPEFANGKSEVQSHVRTPNFAITDVTALEVGATDLAVADLTINVEGEGAVTFASSDNTDAVTIVDGKLHAVAAGTATITANLAANGIYKAATATFDVTVVAATVKYAITFDGNGADGGSAPEAIADKAAGAEVTLPANTWTKTDKVFDGWKVSYVDGESVVHEVPVAANVFTMPAYNVTVQAQWAEISVWATTYTSNVTLSYTGTGEANSQVRINDEDYAAQKVGSSGNDGSVVVTVPYGTHTLHFHAVAWNGKSVTIAASGVENMSESSFTLTADPGFKSSGTYTLENDPVGQYFVMTFTAVTEETQITFSKTAGDDKRFMLYGVNQEGGVLPVLENIEIIGDLTSKSGYKAGDDLNMEGLTVYAYYTLGGDPYTNEDITNKVEWSYDALVEGQTSVTITATYKGQTDDITIKDLEPVASADPKIYVSTLNVNFASVEVGESVPAAETVTVTLTNVASVTATLGGTNADAFSVSPASLTESGDITISILANTDAAASYAATLTISDGEGGADDKTVNLSFEVTEPVSDDDVSGTWTLVTNATTLAAGKKVIIAQYVEADGAINTMASQSSNNRSVIASTVAGTTLTPAVGTKVMTLANAGEGKFYLMTSDGEYLYNASTSSKSYLRTKAEEENVSWTIAVDAEGVATITSVENTNRTQMRYNPNTSGSPLFNCYASGQNDIALYMLEEDTPEPPVDYGSYQRSITAGNYGTICLPQAGKISGAKLYDIADFDSDLSMIFVDEINNGEMEAGRPYLFYATSGQLTVTYSSATVEATAGEANGLYGFYNLLDPSAQYNIPKDAGNYILYQNQYWFVNSDNARIANYRAYIKIDEITTTVPVPGRRRVAMTVNGPKMPTGFENIDASDQPMKLMIDGQIYILRGEKIYDTTGRLVK